MDSLTARFRPSRRNRLRSAAVAAAGMLTVLLGALMAPLPPASAQQPPQADPPDCPQSSRILLASSQGWSLTYSWRGGLGPGSVQVTIGADGNTRVEARPGNRLPAQVRAVHLPPDVVANLAHVIDDTGLLCARSVKRPHVMFDLGRWSVRVRQAAYDKELIVDECHSLENGAGFSAVIKLLEGQEALLGPEIAWGPYATTGGPPCPGP